MRNPRTVSRSARSRPLPKGPALPWTDYHFHRLFIREQPEGDESRIPPPHTEMSNGGPRALTHAIFPLPWKTAGANANPSGPGREKPGGRGNESVWREGLLRFGGAGRAGLGWPHRGKRGLARKPAAPTHRQGGCSAPLPLGRPPPRAGCGATCGAYRRRSAAVWAGPGETDKRSKEKVSRSNRRSPWRGSRRSWRSCSAACLPWGARPRPAGAALGVGAGSALRGGPPAPGLGGCGGLPDPRPVSHGPPGASERCHPPPRLLPPPPLGCAVLSASLRSAPPLRSAAPGSPAI